MGYNLDNSLCIGNFNFSWIYVALLIHSVKLRLNMVNLLVLNIWFLFHSSGDWILMRCLSCLVIYLFIYSLTYFTIVLFTTFDGFFSQKAPWEYFCLIFIIWLKWVKMYSRDYCRSWSRFLPQTYGPLIEKLQSLILKKQASESYGKARAYTMIAYMYMPSL